MHTKCYQVLFTHVCISPVPVQLGLILFQLLLSELNENLFASERKKNRKRIDSLHGIYDPAWNRTKIFCCNSLFSRWMMVEAHPMLLGLIQFFYCITRVKSDQLATKVKRSCDFSMTQPGVEPGASAIISIGDLWRMKSRYTTRATRSCFLFTLPGLQSKWVNNAGDWQGKKISRQTKYDPAWIRTRFPWFSNIFLYCWKQMHPMQPNLVSPTAVTGDEGEAREKGQWSERKRQSRKVENRE
jgi:hypothetical protein